MRRVAPAAASPACRAPSSSAGASRLLKVDVIRTPRADARRERDGRALEQAGQSRTDSPQPTNQPLGQHCVRPSTRVPRSPPIVVRPACVCGVGRCARVGWTTQEARWSGRADLNGRPPAPKAGALPSCATPRRQHYPILTGRPQVLQHFATGFTALRAAWRGAPHPAARGSARAVVARHQHSPRRVPQASLG